MATIICAEHAGACYGVERALRMVREAAQSHEGSVQTLGPLIHNPQVVEELEHNHGVTVAQDADHVSGDTVVIRSHGVVPEVIQHLHALDKDVVDATCPYVKKVHAAAERLVREGYQVLVVGEAGHPEVEGILGHAPSAVAVVNPDDLEHLSLSRKVGVVVQTTQSRTTLASLVSAILLKGSVDELKVVDTICEATAERQRAAAALAQKADVMIVIGGRNSANTTRLAEICATYCNNTHHVETADELAADWFENAEIIGITAGASTPASQIASIQTQIEQLCHD